MNHSDKQRKHVKWEWITTGQRAVELLRAIRPFLRIKEKQAWLALEFRANFTSYKSKGAVPMEEFALREGFALALQESKREGMVAI